MKARKKPVVVEVLQLKMCSARSYRKCKDFVGKSWVDHDNMPNGLPGIETLEGIMEVSDGDYIIKGVQGEYYPCKSDIFHETYEILEEAESSIQPNKADNQVAESGLQMASIHGDITVGTLKAENYQSIKGPFLELGS